MEQKNQNNKYKFTKNKFLKNKITNFNLVKGKKQISEICFFKCIKLLQKTTKKDSKNILKLAIINNLFILYYKLIKKRKFNINIPYLIKKKVRTFFSLKIIIKKAFKNSKKSFCLNLKNEFYNLANKNPENTSFKTDIYKLIYVNKNFSHYRWF